MKAAVKKVFLPAAVMVLVAGLILLGVGAAIIGTMPPWRDAWEM